MLTYCSFSAATLGQPKSLHEENIQTEFPADLDDESITEDGFLSTVPGELTKLSCALSLFRITRILSKVLDELYPAAPSYTISQSKFSALRSELSTWLSELPSPLRSYSTRDNPDTDIIAGRAPILVG